MGGHRLSEKECHWVSGRDVIYGGEDYQGHKEKRNESVTLDVYGGTSRRLGSSC